MKTRGSLIPFVITLIILASAMPVGATDIVIDKDVSIQASTLWVEGVEVYKDNTVAKVKFSADGSLNFFLVDQSTYNVLLQDLTATFYPLAKREGVASLDEQFELGLAGNYYFLWYNPSLSQISLDIELVSVEDPSSGSALVGFLIIGGIIAALGGGVFYLYKRQQSNKQYGQRPQYGNYPQPQQPYQGGYQSQPQQPYQGGYQSEPQQSYQGGYQPQEEEPTQPVQPTYEPEEDSSADVSSSELDYPQESESQTPKGPFCSNCGRPRGDEEFCQNCGFE